MAANDYYNSHPANQHTTTTTTSKPQNHGSSPYLASPFGDDHAYQSTNPSATSFQPVDSHHTDTSYHGYSNDHPNSHKQSNDPFADANSIALSEHPQHHGQKAYHDQQHQQQYAAGADGLPPQEPARNRKKPSVPFPQSQRWPIVCWVLTAVQIGVFVGEIIKNSTLTKSPIAIKPQFNPMIGPSFYVLINMGARFVPCMRTPVSVETPNAWPCPNATSLDAAPCSISELCGFGAKIGDQPSQAFRFITPIFLHAGIIHIAFNLIVQLLLGAQMEKEIGSLRFLIIYLASGVFGFVLGGNFSPEGTASTGASGALAGIIALVLLDLFYTWRERPKPVKDLIFLLIDLAIAFVIGLLPGVDNFAHIGGFLMGLGLGIVFLHSPSPLRRRIGEMDPSYATVQTAPKTGMQSLLKNPIGFFKGRKPLWWIWWLVRAAFLVLSIVMMIVLFNNFYRENRGTCKWCKHLTCLPIANWCDLGQLKVTTTTLAAPGPTPPPTSPRMLL